MQYLKKLYSGNDIFIDVYILASLKEGGQENIADVNIDLYNSFKNYCNSNDFDLIIFNDNNYLGIIPIEGYPYGFKSVVNKKNLLDVNEFVTSKWWIATCPYVEDVKMSHPYLSISNYEEEVKKIKEESEGKLKQLEEDFYTQNKELIDQHNLLIKQIQENEAEKVEKVKQAHLINDTIMNDLKTAIELQNKAVIAEKQSKEEIDRLIEENRVLKEKDTLQRRIDSLILEKQEMQKRYHELDEKYKKLTNPYGLLVGRGTQQRVLREASNYWDDDD